MGRLSLLSIGLFILPIAITLAILIGVETWRVSTGKMPLSSQDNRITTQMYCQKEFGVQPNPGRYVCKAFPPPALAFRVPPRLGSPQPWKQPRAPPEEGLGPNSTGLLFFTLTCQDANLLPVNPNQWGVVPGDPLNLCMNVRHVPAKPLSVFEFDNRLTKI
jgi:hypothetical protein